MFKNNVIELDTVLQRSHQVKADIDFPIEESNLVQDGQAFIKETRFTAIAEQRIKEYLNNDSMVFRLAEVLYMNSDEEYVVLEHVYWLVDSETKESYFSTLKLDNFTAQISRKDTNNLSRLCLDGDGLLREILRTLVECSSLNNVVKEQVLTRLQY